MKEIIFSILISFIIGMIISPIVIKLSYKLKARQTILGYVTQHSQKQGIPTLGGLIFIISSLVTSLILGVYKTSFGLMAILIMLCYGVVGFLDDFIKIVLKRNLGLKAYQKLIAQFVIALIGGYFCFKSEFIGSKIIIPFTDKMFDLSYFYVPFAMVVFIALTNAVNLTDGLDGLAGSTTSLYFSFLAIIIMIIIGKEVNLGNTIQVSELKGLLTFLGAIIGGLIAFLWKNTNKAKVFMGDVGSLALGGVCAVSVLFIKNPLISILIGLVFVISCLSVIIQVISFKIKKKRVFLMSPFHHHLELKGYNESKIVAFYSIITVITGLITLLGY